MSTSTSTPIPARPAAEPDTRCYLVSNVCGCAVGFASADTSGKGEENSLRRTLRDWIRKGYKVTYTTERAELNEHMKTWGDCPHGSGQSEDDVESLLALRADRAVSA